MRERKIEIEGKISRVMPVCSCGAEMTPFYNDKSEKMALGGYCVACEKFETFPENDQPYPRYVFGESVAKAGRPEKITEIKLRTYCIVPVCDECGSEMINYNKYSNQEATRGVYCLNCQKAETLTFKDPHYPRYEEEVL